MKNLLFVFAIAILVLTGCNNNETLMSDNQLEGIAYVFNQDAEVSSWEAIPMDQLQTRIIPLNKKPKGPKSQVKGMFTGFGGSIYIEFMGKQDDKGVKGNAIFQQALTLPFPPFSGFVDVVLQTICLGVVGDEAIYAAEIVVVNDNGGFPPGGPFDLGNILHFRVKDNGNGSKAPFDQYNSGLFITPAPTVDCGASLPWGSYLDVEGEKDKIEVKYKDGKE